MKAEMESTATPLPAVKSISVHAIERFRQRTGSKQTDEQICFKLFELFEQSREVKLKPPFNVIALLNHNFREARYFRAGGFILVVEGDCISTIHGGEAKRWEEL